MKVYVVTSIFADEDEDARVLTQTDVFTDRELALATFASAKENKNALDVVYTSTITQTENPYA